MIRPRFRGILFTLAILLVGLSVVSWNPRAGRFYAERNSRVAGITKIYAEERFLRNSLLVYVRGRLDSLVFTIAENGGNPYAALSSIGVSDWVKAEENELIAAKGVYANLSSRISFSKFYSQPIDVVQCRTILCERPKRGCVYIRGSISFFLRDTYSNASKEGKVRIGAVHPVRIYTLYDAWQIADECVSSLLKQEYRITAWSAKEAAEEVAQEIEEALITELVEEIVPFLSAEGEISFEMWYEISVKALVRQRVYGRLVYENGMWKCVGKTIRTWDVSASISYRVEITDLKSDALVYIGGVKRVTYKKRGSKPLAQVASRELVMRGCRGKGEWTATQELKGEFSYP